jgi:hypothetical protein
VLSLLDLGLHFFEGSRVTWGLKQKHMQARPIQVHDRSQCTNIELALGSCRPQTLPLVAVNPPVRRSVLVGAGTPRALR